MTLLLGGARHQIGTRYPARQTGSGDSACCGLLGPLRLPDEFVVRRGTPGTGGGARVTRTATRHRGSGTVLRGLLRDGRCLRPGGRLLTALLRAVEPVRLQGVVQRRTTVPGARRRQRLRLRLRRQDRTVLRLTRGSGGRTRGTEVLVVPAARTRSRQPLVLRRLRTAEVRTGELRGARRVLVLREVGLRGRCREVRAGELGGGAGALPVVQPGTLAHGRVHRPLELAGGLGLLVTARGVERTALRHRRVLRAPAGGLRALRLRVATGQFGTGTADGRQLTAGVARAAGLLETALIVGGVVVPGLLRLRRLPSGRTVLVAGLTGLVVLPRPGLTEQVGLTLLRTAGIALAARCTGPCAAAEGAGEPAALTRWFLPREVLRAGAGESSTLEPGVRLTLLVRLRLLPLLIRLALLVLRLARTAAVTRRQCGPRTGARTDLSTLCTGSRAEARPVAVSGNGAVATGALLTRGGFGAGCLPPCATSTGSMTSAVVPPESDGRSWIRMP